MKRLIAALALALAAALTMGTPATAATTADGTLSPRGQSAIEDLRTCVASEPVINVYYLVDDSQSLVSGDDGGPGSDPDAIRGRILAGSLDQLGDLGDGVTINWAAGLFSTQFTEVVPWQPRTDASARVLQDALSHTPQGYTNWPAALAGAQRSLATQAAATPGCELLIWLTDGLIDIQSPNGQQQEDLDALNALCGGALAPGGSPAARPGTFEAFRQSGVVVIGALLAVTPAAQAAAGVMQPLVEGDATCGGDVPAGSVNGAFVKANTPDALNSVFQRLGAQLGGGFPRPFAEDGSFLIEPGVARFRIVAGPAWTLHPPASSGLAPANAAADWLRTTGDGVIDVTTTDENLHGTWRLEAPAAPEPALFLFSDLHIAFDATNNVELNADGGIDAILTASVRDAAGDPADLADYQPGSFTASLINQDGSATPLAGADVDVETGTITIPLPADVSAAQITVEASLKPLRTEASALDLAPITTRETVKTTLPAEFPSISPDSVPARLSDLIGSNGRATGIITVTGPTAGGAGEACIDPAAVTVDGDTGDRADSWHFAVADGTALACVPVPEGESVDIPVAATNEVPAEAEVRASVPVLLKTAAGREIAQTVPLAFHSTHPVNTAAVLGITLALLIASILLPLLALWIANAVTARIATANIQRASFALRASANGVRLVDAPAGETSIMERFRDVRASSPRAVTDADLGKMRTVAGPFSVAYDVVPAAGQTIIAAGTRSGTAGGVRRKNGTVRFRALPLGEFWAVVVPTDELRRTKAGDEVAGAAVLYHGSATGGPTYTERLDALRGSTDIVPAIDRARQSAAPVETRAPRGTAPASTPSDAPTGAPPPRPGASATAAPPPRPGSSPAGGPPPRPGSR